MVLSLAAVVGPQGVWAQTPIPPAAPDFALDAAQSDQYEIAAAEDALAQSQDPRVRSFAQHMIDDHERLRETLGQAAAASGSPPPPQAMSSDQASLLGALQSLRGPDFDRAYARQQVLAHDQALAVVQSYAAAGSDANLRGVAQKSAPIIQRHLDMAEQLRGAVGGS